MSLEWTEAVESRFLSKIQKSDGCWEWTAGKSSAGYGMFSYGKHKNTVTVAAHRKTYEIHKGPIPNGLFICHRCDNPGCVNPDHLFAGSPKENTQDMIAKGRRVVPSTENRARGDKHRSKTHPESVLRGESHPRAKLTVEQVKEIRSSPMCGAALARKFGITNVTVSRIRRNVIWKEMEMSN